MLSKAVQDLIQIHRMGEWSTVAGGCRLELIVIDFSRSVGKDLIYCLPSNAANSFPCTFTHTLLRLLFAVKVIVVVVIAAVR